MSRTLGRAAALACGVLLAGAAVRAADGDVYIGNQAGMDYILSLEAACPAGESFGLSFLESPVAERKTTVVRLSQPSQRHTIKAGECAILSWTPPAGPGPHRRSLRLAEAGGVDVFRVEYRVSRVDGRAVGEVDAVPLVGPVDGPVAAFDKLDEDILVFWGR